MTDDLTLPRDDAATAEVVKLDWLDRFRNATEPFGTSEALGDRHRAALIERGECLFVSFETVQSIYSLNQNTRPLGWDAAERLGWSSLTVVSDGDTWFRAPEIYDYLDRLIDDGFFDRFDRVMVYGAGSAGYAAAAFSAAAPGAVVMAIQPQATLDPAVTGWDDRFSEMRRVSFTDRFGYAPDMLDAAQRAFILYDPGQRLDAMHAALFRAPHVTALPLRHLGGTIQTSLITMGIFDDLIDLAAQGQLDDRAFSRLWRARREYLPYMRSLLGQTEARGHAGLTRLLCQHVTARHAAPRFAKRLRELDKVSG